MRYATHKKMRMSNVTITSNLHFLLPPITRKLIIPHSLITRTSECMADERLLTGRQGQLKAVNVTHNEGVMLQLFSNYWSTALQGVNSRQVGSLGDKTDNVEPIQTPISLQAAPCIASPRVAQNIFAVLVDWYIHIVLTVSFKLISLFYIYWS